MASAPLNRRRRSPLSPSSNMTPLKTDALSLRKSGTFHSPTNVASDFCDPIVNFAFMPKRSHTSAHHLEELVNDAGASVRRVASILENFDRTIAGESSTTDENILSDPEVLPLPSFMLDNTSLDSDCMDVDSKPETEDHQHDSDSGIGSSIGETKNGKSLTDNHAAAQPTDYYKVRSAARASTRHSVKTSVSSTHTAVTKSVSAIGSPDSRLGRKLSKTAIRHIQDRIVKPILAEKALKAFHPLVADVPHRIGSKNICNLRDLEKTLIFLAPVSAPAILGPENATAHCILRNLKEFSTSPASYLRFCETSIQCIHTTVDYLCERDQRLPTDRPYTTNYFLDLVEQIRRYAAIMAATRQKEEAGEQLDEMDYSPYVSPVAQCLVTHTSYKRPQAPTSISLIGISTKMQYRDEKITVRGGLANSGRPMELVREKDGKTIPLADGISIDDAVTKTFASAKRALEDEDEDADDDVRRSMARRRKSDKPGDVMHPCNSCSKEFKRPCDLTKHMKTHIRPWKCTEPTCRYFEEGWPTEKERDRHVNDKHSANPPQYKCIYPNCTYVSKRESNCKQHMEKTHGYVYVRSKSNGRKKGATGSSGSVQQTPQTPLTPFLATPGSGIHNLPTPATPFDHSPLIPAFGDFNYGYGNVLDTPALSNEDIQETYRRASITTAGTELTYSSGYSPQQPTSFEDAISPDDIAISHDILFDGQTRFAAPALPSTTLQQPTPEVNGVFEGFDFNQPLQLNSNIPSNHAAPHLSPAGQADMTLFSPQIDNGTPFDEGFHEEVNQFRPTADFTLYDTSDNTAAAANMNWFEDLNNVGDHFGNFYSANEGDNFMDGFQHH